MEKRLCSGESCFLPFLVDIVKLSAYNEDL